VVKGAHGLLGGSSGGFSGRAGSPTAVTRAVNLSPARVSLVKVRSMAEIHCMGDDWAIIVATAAYEGLST